MHRETTLFLEHQLRADRPVIELISANYSFINAHLARHYGIRGVSGTRFRRVALPTGDRRGLLGQASILTLTSTPARTSPVQRSVWLTSRLLGARPSPMPFTAPLREDVNPLLAGRERFQQHRANPACASCHAAIDAIGFPFETFDAIGRSRTDDAGAPIDATGLLVDVAINGPAELRQALLRRELAVVTTATEALLSFAIGRPLDYYDMPAVRRVVRDAAARDWRWSSIIVGVAKSIPFVMGSAPERTARSTRGFLLPSTRTMPQN